MNTENKVKFIGTIVGVILFILLMAGMTYAWITWNSENINIAGKTECFTIDYTKGKNISNESVILFDESKIISDNKITIKNGMAITNVIAFINEVCTIPGDITISMTASNLNNAFISGNSVGAFKYAIASYNPIQYKNVNTSALNGISFDIIKKGSITSNDKITLVTEELSYAKKGFMIIFYIDGDLVNNDAADSTFSASIDAVVTQKQGEIDPSSKKPTLISHITNLYNNNKDTELVTRNNISYRYASIYDKDDDTNTSGGLMNDRKGSMDVGEDDGNIRYYGTNPSNYIYFNCSDYFNQTDSTCEKWRIIGIVDGKVKIARDTVLSSTMKWNTTAGVNNWENASLNTYLNGEYYESFRTKNTDTVDSISKSIWYLGGYVNANLYADDFYINERIKSTSTIYTGNPLFTEANIGLMSASDYGYATDLSVCDKTIRTYADSTECKDKDWLLKSGGTNTTQWLITHLSQSSTSALFVYQDGNVLDYGVSATSGVRPVLYLNPKLAIGSEGDGTNGNPYRISIG